MSGSWPPPRGPLDWVAHSIEKKYVAKGEPWATGREAFIDWVDPTRPAVMLGLGRSSLKGKPIPSEEQYVIAAGRGYFRPTRYNDADYPSTHEAQSPHTLDGSHRLINDAIRFVLRRESREDVLPAELPSFFEACLNTLKVEYRVDGSSQNVVTPKTLILRPLIRPRFAPCLPLPSDTIEWRCTASGATWQAMLSLSKVFGGIRPPIALITGPPGSGKNAYAKAVHYGQRRTAALIRTRDQKKRLKTVPLVGFEVAESLNTRLPQYLGKLQELGGGTIFLDEVDKAKPELRSSLLRILENREYEAPNGPKPCDKVAFVIAAGKPLGALRGEDPPDFWTRIEVHIPVADPLTAGSQFDREGLLAAFFKFFWWDAVSDWLAGLLDAPDDVDWDAFFTSEKTARALASEVFKYSIGRVNWEVARGFVFTPCDHISDVAAEFASVLSPHLERRQLSLRGLRSAVGAVQRATRSYTLDMALSGKSSSWMDEARRAVHNAIGTVIQVLPDEYESGAS